MKTSHITRIFRNWSITTKIVASVGGIVSILLFVGGLVLIWYEVHLVEIFIDEHVSRLNYTIDERAQKEIALLRKNVEFNARILSEAGAIYLQNWDTEHLKNSLLRPYLNYAEILAIEVVDGAGDPFAAAWKVPEITVGKQFPGDLGLDESLSYASDALYEGENIGSFRVYYTDAMLTNQIERIKDESLVESDTFHALARSRLYSVITIHTIGMILVLVIQMTCLILLLRVLVLNPLNTVSDIAQKLADFDLTVTVETNKNDEIGTLLKSIAGMVQAFRKIVSQVQRSGEQVSSSSAELAAASRQQEAIITHQAVSTENAVQSVEKISGIAADLEHTMQYVTSMSQDAASLASNSQNELAQIDEAVRQMAGESQSVSNRLHIILEESQNITSVVTRITEVANQTKLLSLNASLEAAKAGGEYGRGFTIIAREVRRLAEQAADATRDIDHIINKMQTAVTAGVLEMDRFIARVQHSVKDVARLSVQLTQVIEKVQALSPNFEEVNTAMSIQARTAHDINLTMRNLNEEMQQTIISLKEAFIAIEQLNQAARNMQDEVLRFKIG